MGINLEGLSYEIKATAPSSQTSNDIEKFASSLEKLRSSVKGFSTGNVATKLSEIVKPVNAIDESKVGALSRLVQGLHAFGSVKINKNVSTRIAEIGDAVNGITDETISKIDRLADAFKKLDGVKVNLGGISRGLKKIPDASEATTDNSMKEVTAEELEEQALGQALPTALITANTAELGAFASVFPSIATGVSFAGTWLSAFAEKIKEVGKAVASSPIAKGLKSLFMLPIQMGASAAASVKTFTSSLGGLVRQFARIALIKMIRGIISGITAAIKDGTKALYEYSQAMGTAYAASLDSLATSANYLSNSFAAMAAPLVNALAPAIDFVIDKIVQLMNWFNMLISAFTGAAMTTIAKKVPTAFGGASKGIGGTGGAAKKAAKELKRYILAFDEINALGSQNNGSGSGGGGGGAGGAGGLGEYAFEQVAINSNIQNLADTLKGFIAAGDWAGLGTFLGEKFNDLVDLIPWKEFGTNVGRALNAAITTSYHFLKTADFENLGSNIASFLNNAMRQINTDTLGRTLATVLTDGLDFALGFVLNFNARNFGSKVRDFFVGFFDEMSKWIDSKDWDDIGYQLTQKVFDFFRGLKPGEIIGAFFNFIKSVVGGGLELLKGAGFAIFDNTLGAIGEKIAQRISKGVEDFFNDHPFLKSLVDKVMSLADKLSGGKSNPVLPAPSGRGKTTTKKQANEITKFVADQWEKGLEQGTQKYGSTNPSVPVIADLNKYNDVIPQKNLYGFNAGLNTKQDNIPASQKFLQQFTADLTATSDKIPPAQKFVDQFTADLNATRDGVPTAQKKIDNMTAVLTNPLDKLTSKTSSGWTAKVQQATDHMSASEKTFGSKANFTSSKDSLSSGEKTIKVTASITKVLKPSQNPTINVNGKIVAAYKAMGGAFYGGGWHNIPQYAGGTVNAGSMFIAGERGPEVVGHIGGRTEVLNASQLASTMYTSIMAGLAKIAPMLSTINANIITAANGVIAAESYRPSESYDDPARTEYNANVLVQNDLLREMNDVLRQILEKDNSVEITTTSLTSAFNRKNQRDGKTVIPVST